MQQECVLATRIINKKSDLFFKHYSYLWNKLKYYNFYLNLFKLYLNEIIGNSNNVVGHRNLIIKNQDIISTIVNSIF